jgi:hypothetical protein
MCRQSLSHSSAGKRKWRCPRPACFPSLTSGSKQPWCVLNVPKGSSLWVHSCNVTVYPKASFTRSDFRPAGREHNLELKTSPVLTGRSKEQERFDQAVVHAQWPAMDRNSIIALYLLYRRRKRRRNRLHWVHPIIKKREEFRDFYTLIGELRDDENKFLIIFECLFHLSMRCIAVWRRVFSVLTVKCWLLQSAK